RRATAGTGAGVGRGGGGRDEPSVAARGVPGGRRRRVGGAAARARGRADPWGGGPPLVAVWALARRAAGGELARLRERPAGGGALRCGVGKAAETRRGAAAPGSGGRGLDAAGAACAAGFRPGGAALGRAAERPGAPPPAGARGGLDGLGRGSWARGPRPGRG